jgi:VWFA-related protein
MRSAVRVWAAVLVVAASIQVGSAQTLPAASEEVHVSSRQYVPAAMRADTTLVQVGVVVRDSKGRAVAGLRQEDFQVFDQGKERGIVSFSVDSRLVPGGAGSVSAKNGAIPGASVPAAAEAPRAPRFIALYFDDFGTPAGDLMRTKRAAIRFVEDGTDPANRVALFTSTAGRITEYTGDKKMLVAAIEKVQAHPRFNPNGLSPCPRITPYEAYLISNHLNELLVQGKVLELQACAGAAPPTTQPGRRGSQAVSLTDPAPVLIRQQAQQTWEQVRVASEDTIDSIGSTLEDLSKRPGSRMLLLVSSGFLTETMEPEQDHLVNRALAAGVVINSLDAKGLFVETPGRPFGEDPIPRGTPDQVMAFEEMTKVASQEATSYIMASLSEATGGLFFHHNNDYSFGFRELGSIPEVTYLLAFRPDDSAFDGKYHKLKVRQASSNAYSVEARPGYFAPAKAAQAEETWRPEVDRQVMRTDVVQQFPAQVGIEYGAKTPSGATPARVQMHVDLTGLEFQEREGRHTQKLIFVFALLDQKGGIVSAREGVMEFALTDAKFKSLLQSGVNSLLTLEAPAGSYRLRAVAVDGVHGKVASLAYAVQIP